LLDITPGQATVSEAKENVSKEAEMSLVSDSYYALGEPEEYRSIYGYQKRRFQVYPTDAEGNRNGGSVGKIKEEPLLDENGKLWGRCFYSRDLSRPCGKYRFYPSPEALIAAFGGKVLSKPAAENTVQPTMPQHFAQALGETQDPEDAQDLVVAGTALASIHAGEKLVAGSDLAHRLDAVEKQLKAVEDKVFLGPLKTRRTATKPATKPKPAKKSVKKPAAKAKAPPRRKKLVA
jgi:hypothetical protein